MDLSIVIPAYNEKENIVELYKRLSAVLKQLKKTYEIIFVDDGSSDGTFVELDKISKTDKNVKVIKILVKQQRGLQDLIVLKGI